MRGYGRHPQLPPGPPRSIVARSFPNRSASEYLTYTLEDVILLAVLTRNLSGDLPFVAICKIDPPVGVIFHPDLLTDARLLHLSGIPGRPGCFGDGKRIHMLTILLCESGATHTAGNLSIDTASRQCALTGRCLQPVRRAPGYRGGIR